MPEWRGAVAGDVFPNLGDVAPRLGVKAKTFGHLEPRVQELFFALPQFLEEAIAVDRIYPAALEVVITAVQHVAPFGQFSTMPATASCTNSSAGRPL